MRLLRNAIALVLAALLAACSGGTGQDAPAPTVHVGGTLSGLGAGKAVAVADEGGATAVLQANGVYSLELAAGAHYSLRILAQPDGQTCTLAQASGTAAADVTDAAIHCSDNPPAPPALRVAGTVQGLDTGKALVLRLATEAGTQNIAVLGDGPFEFPQAVTGSYAVSVYIAPTGQGCTVENGQGVAGQTPPAAVHCAPDIVAFALGGTLSGSTAPVTLRNNANADVLVLASNGAFVFAQLVVQGAAYNVTVTQHGAGQTCTIANGNGNAGPGAPALVVTCIADAGPIVPPVPPVAVPSIPSDLTIAYGIKSFHLAWGTVTTPVGGGTVSYRVFEDPDGPGPAAATQAGGTSTTAARTLTVADLLHTRLSARYSVQACNSAGCSAPGAAVTADVARAIGYFKASNTGTGDMFGIAVALSGDGNTMAVSSPGEDSAATGVGGDQASGAASNSGAVYVFTRGPSGWQQEAYLKAGNTGQDDSFGTSLALSFDGSTLAVGAHLEKGGLSGVGANPADDSRSFAGAAYVFIRDAGGWSQQSYIKSSNPDISDEFGGSVALSADGNTLAVGSVGEDSSATGINGAQGSGAATSGAVYVFIRDGAGSWSQQAYLKASNTGANDRFGHSLAFSADGNTLAVGAVGEASNATGVGGNQADDSLVNAGAAYVFTRAAGIWSQQAYLKASNTQANHVFGTSVVLSADGATLVAGATGDALAAGAAYAFTRNPAGTWLHQAYITPGNAAPNQWFGRVVALSADGLVLAVGARNESSNATGIGGNGADASAAEAGAAYVFTAAGGAWTQQAYLKASNTRAGDRLSSVALSADGRTLAVGARNEDSGAAGLGGDQADGSAPNAGAVYLY